MDSFLAVKVENQIMQQDTHSEGDPNYPTTSASRRGGPLRDINSSIDDQEKKGFKS